MRRGPSSSQKFIHPVKESGVEPPQCLLEKGVTGSSVKTKLLKKAGVEVELDHEVTVAESRVELECKEDKESGERELDWSTELRGVVWDHIAKAHKFVEQEVIVARSGCIV